MSVWLCKENSNFSSDSLPEYLNVDQLINGDEVYVYSDDYEEGMFQLKFKFEFDGDNFHEDTTFDQLSTDLPYSVLYKTKSASAIIKLTNEEINFLLNTNDDTQNEENENLDVFKNFLSKLEVEENLRPTGISNNIIFNIGQPNTGKSYNFEESKLFNPASVNKYKYLKIPVSGGIGNEYKGLQNTDLAITYDPIKKKLRFGEFLQMLMSAIVNPKVPHVVFLDDFHNQDISSLLSEYTPLFKGQQKREVNAFPAEHIIYSTEFKNVDEFIILWNSIISTHCSNIPKVPLTNRISGKSIELVFPDNFYLLGAANFNENSLNIFADWEDRASINYIDPITSFSKEDETNEFLQCYKYLNIKLKGILESNNIFDYEKYCFGMWKTVKADGTIINNIDNQKEIINFFFGMIKNSLKFNNKNSEINTIGWELMKEMQSNSWFKTHIETLQDSENIDYKILHKHNIYEDEI